MSESLIRKLVRNILVETRGPLALPVVLRAWIDVAAQHGATHNQPHIDGPEGSSIRWAETATLIVPPQHAQKVFDSLTSEVQEYVLRHWRSEEYFNAMISGVHIGLVRNYEQPNYAGMKGGFTQINGAINEEGLMVGRMSGFLTMKYDSRSYNDAWCDPSPLRNSLIENDRWAREGLLINRQMWKELMERDLAQSESTLVHEFQHWFQESVYYAQPMAQIPTKRRGKRNQLPNPRKTTPNIRDLKPIHLMMAKKSFKGVDWNQKMRVRGATAYKLSDAEAFFDSYNPSKDKDEYGGTVSMTKLALSKMNSDGARRAFIEELLYDYLKLQNFLDHNDIADIADYAKDRSRWNAVKTRTQKILWDKGHEISTHIGGRSTRPNWGEEPNPLRDTPKGSGEKTVQGTDSLLNSLGHQFNIDILRSSDFDKQGNLKPGKEPVKPTLARIKKATWVVLGIGVQSLPRKSSGTSSWKLAKERGTAAENNNTSFDRPKWTDRWVEFDAVATEYMVGVVKRNVETGGKITHYLVTSSAEAFSSWVNEEVQGKLRRRGFRHTVEKEVNADHVKSMAERVADRLVETVEENSYEDWFDKEIKSGTRVSNLVPVERFDAWAGGDPRSAPMGTASYWRWIFAKASGENV